MAFGVVKVSKQLNEEEQIEFVDCMELVGWTPLRDEHDETRAFIHENTNRLIHYDTAVAYWQKGGATPPPF